ncbi:3-hydroxyacyl-CoA dehydrogenase type-2-like [Rhynchophorus ferrugineus]
MLLKGSVFVVTGGASDEFGKATVKKLLEEGASVVICDLPTRDLQIYGDDKSIFLPINIASETDVKTLLAVIQDKFGKLHGIINCIDAYETCQIFDAKENQPHDLKLFTDIIDENVIGIFNLLRLALPLLAQNTPKIKSGRGIIINMTNTAAVECSLRTCAYAASKAAVIGMTEALAQELDGLRIRCVCISTAPPNKVNVKPVNGHIRNSLNHGRSMDDPKRFAELVKMVIESTTLNGTTIQLDGL